MDKIRCESWQSNKKKLTSKGVKEKIYPLIIKKIKNNEVKCYPIITNYYKTILLNLDSIEEKANEIKLKIKKELKNTDEAKEIKNYIKNIPIIIKIKAKQKEKFFYQNKLLFEVFENITFKNSANCIKNAKNSKCNIYTDKKAVVYPGGSFYYPFSIDKVNVKYNLKDDKNLFLLSKKAYIDFFIGKTFLEIYHSFYFMGLNSYITATTLNDERLKEFQKDIKDSKSDINSLIDLIDKNRQNRSDLLINFYFYEIAKTGGGKEIVEYIKDVIPTRLVDLLNLFKKLTNYYK